VSGWGRLERRGVRDAPFRIARSHASAVRTKAGLRSGETMVTGDEWPIFLYYDCAYDPERPWDGLFRNSLLISVSTTSLNFFEK
jgi:hypothetical protein